MGVERNMSVYEDITEHGKKISESICPSGDTDRKAGGIGDDSIGNMVERDRKGAVQSISAGVSTRRQRQALERFGQEWKRRRAGKLLKRSDAIDRKLFRGRAYVGERPARVKDLVELEDCARQWLGEDPGIRINIHLMPDHQVLRIAEAILANKIYKTEDLRAIGAIDAEIEESKGIERTEDSKANEIKSLHE